MALQRQQRLLCTRVPAELLCRMTTMVKLDPQAVPLYNDERWLRWRLAYKSRLRFQQSYCCVLSVSHHVYRSKQVRTGSSTLCLIWPVFILCSTGLVVWWNRSHTPTFALGIAFFVQPWEGIFCAAIGDISVMHKHEHTQYAHAHFQKQFCLS